MTKSDLPLYTLPRAAIARYKILVLACAFLPGLTTLPVLAADSAFAPANALPVTASGMAASIQTPTFDILEYVVDGNSLLSDRTIEKVMATYLGEAKTLRDVDGARSALERAYHDAGYLTVIVSIPEQKVDSGEVALHVVEAGIDRLKVKGAEYTLPSNIKMRLPELAEGNVPNFNKVQEQLAVLNRNADMKVTPILRAGKLPGTVEIQLDTEDQLPLHGSVEYSNRQTPNTTAQRLSASLRYDNLWQRGHSFGMTVQTAPERTSDVRVIAGTYVMPMSDDGDALSFYAVHSRSAFASLANAPGLGLLGNSDTLGFRFTRTLGATVDYSHNFSVGLDHKDVGQTLQVLGGSSTSTPITYVPLVGSYTANIFGENRSTIVDVTATSGLRGVLGNTDAAFEAKRHAASASFLSLRSALQHTENLGHWAVYGKLELQLASGPLVPTEQFVAGGAESVRGYLEGERAGDGGIRATVELRTPPFKPGGPNSDWKMTGLAFFDAARLTTREPVYPQPAQQSLRGVGIGFRMSVPHGVAIEVDAAHALVDGDTTRAGDNRIHARTVWGF